MTEATAVATTATTATTTTTQAPAQTANTNGVPQGPAWLPGADPDTTAYVSAKGWNDPAAAVTSYRNLEKLFGADRAGHTVQVPSEGADDNTLNAFYTKIGRPGSVDKYSVKAKDISGMPEDVAKSLVDVAFKEGLTDRQVKAIANWNNETGKTLGAKLQQDAVIQLGTQKQALAVEWGAALEKNLQIAKEATAKLGWNKEQISAMEIGLGFDGVMKLAYQLGTKVGEGTFVAGDAGRGSNESGVMAPADAQKSLDELKNDKQFMKSWLDKYDPGHKAAIDKKAQLSRWASGQN